MGTSAAPNVVSTVNHIIVTNFYVANTSFNTLREDKILMKIFEFTLPFSHTTHDLISELGT